MIKVEKPKPPQGLSYVLKASQLQEALDNASIEHHVHLGFWVPQTGGSIFDAHYFLPNANVPFPRISIRAGTVPSSERKAAETVLIEKILPAFISWLSTILAQPKNSPVFNGVPYFNATYERGTIKIIYLKLTF